MSILNCVSDFSFLRNLVYIRGLTRTGTNLALSISTSQTTTAAAGLRELGFTSLVLVGGSVWMGGRVGVIASDEEMSV